MFDALSKVQIARFDTDREVAFDFAKSGKMVPILRFCVTVMQISCRFGSDSGMTLKPITGFVAKVTRRVFKLVARKSR